jgi:hypothetical protein
VRNADRLRLEIRRIGSRRTVVLGAVASQVVLIAGFLAWGIAIEQAQVPVSEASPYAGGGSPGSTIPVQVLTTTARNYYAPGDTGQRQRVHQGQLGRRHRRRARAAA